MYYVYSISFGKSLYIGCTNNLTRRRHQHNENARKRKSKLGRFLSDNNIVLKADNLKILFFSEDRHEALLKERDVTKSCESEGFNMLNDNYTEECSRKGKNLGNTAKDFVVINVKDKTAVKVTDLRQYAVRNGINYKSLHSTIKDDALYKSTYFVFKSEAWDECKNKEDYLSGEYFKKKKIDSWELFSRTHSKTYVVEFPDRHREVVHNLNKFAREHSLTPGTLHATLANGKRTKGYKAVRRIEE